MRQYNDTSPKKLPLIAAVLNFLIPGVGYIYLKGFRSGFILTILWFIFVTIGYLFLFFPGLILHAVCVFTSYYSASFSKIRALEALLTVLILFGSLIILNFNSLPIEVQSILSFIGKATKDSKLIVEEFNNDMKNLTSEMVIEASKENVMEILQNYVNAEIEYKKAHGQFTRTISVLIDEGFIILDLPETKNPVSSFYHAGYHFAHVKKQHDKYVDLTTGFVISAAPLAYKQTGVYTFIVGVNGVILYKDIMGKQVENTKEIDSSWKPAK